ncbi:DNA topoisomerase IB, partial [Micromonospora chalcea]
CPPPGGAAAARPTGAPPRPPTPRTRALAGVMRSVAELLGNTPTVARASYVDPRVVDLYHDGVLAPVQPEMPREAVEKSVLALLEEEAG